MPTREELLTLFDLAAVRALEFGPADRPWIPRETPGVRYIDHVSTEQLREKLGLYPQYKTEDLCEIDFVNDGRSLAEILGDWIDLDLVAASHVIEHVPDLLKWLQDIASVLREGGSLILAAPNKRYTFDFLRRVTSLEDVIADHLEKRRKPSARAMLEATVMYATYNGCITWDKEINPCELLQTSLYEEGYKHASTFADPAAPYCDSHVSVFTPYSFVQILAGLTKLGLMPLELERIEPSGCEFFAILKKCHEKERIAERIAALQQKVSDLPFNADDYYATDYVWREPRLSGQRQHLTDAEIEDWRRELELVKNSVSWRITKPLRALRRFFR